MNTDRDRSDDRHRGGCSMRAVLVIAVLAYLLLIGLSFLPGFRDAISKRMGERLDRDVTIGQAHLGPTFDIVLRDLAWTQGPDEIEAAHIERTTLRWSLADSVKAGSLQFKAVDVEGLVGIVGIPQSSYRQTPRELAKLLAHIGSQYGWTARNKRVRLTNSRLIWRPPQSESPDYATWEGLALTVDPLPRNGQARDFVDFSANLPEPLLGEFFVLPGNSNTAFQVRLMETISSP